MNLHLLRAWGGLGGTLDGRLTPSFDASMVLYRYFITAIIERGPMRKKYEVNQVPVFVKIHHGQLLLKWVGCLQSKVWGVCYEAGLMCFWRKITLICITVSKKK